MENLANELVETTKALRTENLELKKKYYEKEQGFNFQILKLKTEIEKLKTQNEKLKTENERKCTIS